MARGEQSEEAIQRSDSTSDDSAITIEANLSEISDCLRFASTAVPLCVESRERDPGGRFGAHRPEPRHHRVATAGFILENISPTHVIG
jgi:hypothetical protein